MNKIVCIIPAYNEAARIGGVIRLATSHPLIDEVIVVDDGSSDNTAEIARSFAKARVIILPENGGKTRAVRTAILASESEYIMLLDADLGGITEEHLTQLMAPILEGMADVTMSLRGNATYICLFLGFEYISGDRIFPRKCLSPALLEKMLTLPRFGLEVFLNDIFIQSRFRIGSVFWNDVLNVGKIEKSSFWTGVWSQAKMVIDIFRTVGVLSTISQNISMMRLLVSRPTDAWKKHSKH